MRITGGKFLGQQIESLGGLVSRSMTDKVKAALFNTLGDIAGFSVLELYAGSGALGLEALSRGAARVVAIEKNQRVCRIIKANVEKLAVQSVYQLVNAPIEDWLQRVDLAEFDMILSDPPYAHLRAGVLSEAAKSLKSDGIMVVSHTSKIASPELKSLELVKAKIYGDSALSFYRLAGPA